MATTITRESMTDNVTVWNVTRIGSAIYDRIDSVLGSALTLGGVLTVEAFGTHAFSAGGTGNNILRVRNTSAGTGNLATLQLGNDTATAVCALGAFSTTFTTASGYFADGVALDATRAGGLSLIASNAAGDIRLYTGGYTLRLTISDAGVFTPSGATMLAGFLAYNSANDTGVTTGTNIDFDTEIYDEGAHFASDTFTAPVAGRYYLSASVNVLNATGGSIRMGAAIVTSNGSPGFYIGMDSDVPNNAERIFSGSVIVDMDASDTATVKYIGTGNATIVGDVDAGSGASKFTYFCGRLVL